MLMRRGFTTTMLLGVLVPTFDEKAFWWRRRKTKMPDFIETYVQETAKVPSPEIYRLWSAITCVSGVLERKA